MPSPPPSGSHEEKHHLHATPKATPSSFQCAGLPLLAAADTLLLSVFITAAGSAAPNTALPATMTLAPASAARSMVLGARPPSTWQAGGAVQWGVGCD